MVTIKDIAKKAGVCPATVSYCINNTKNIKPETRIRINQAIAELGYIPNAFARRLKSNSSNEIGVVFPGIDDYYHSELLKGIVSCAETKEYSINIAFSYSTPKLERKIIDQFISKNVAGLIILTCQPQNSEYFQNSIIARDIPCVFIDQFPANLDAACLAFDNYRTTHFLTKKLLETNYRKITLMTGYGHFFSENLCMDGYTDALDEYRRTSASDTDTVPVTEQVIETDFSKEGAFREAMYQLSSNPPQAIIASSETITKGILEAFQLCSIKVPETTCVITLGEECWNKSNTLTNIIHTSRTAYSLGKNSVSTLLHNIETPEFFEKKFILFKDNIVDSMLQLPPAPAAVCEPKVSRNMLKILATPLPTVSSLKAVSKEFSNLYDCEVLFEMVSFRELINAIVSDSKKAESDYDIYLFDVSWLTYLVNENALLNITDLIKENAILSSGFLKKNLSNCLYKENFFGIPVIGGAQILFYRKDLFDTPSIQMQFKSQHKLSLRPPKTWAEFNGIARFFTREYNPASPTEYGSSVTGSINEELTLEIMIRLWSYGGGLYDQSGRLILDTPQNVKGFQSLLDTCNYIERDVFSTSIDQTFQDFGNGKTAMLISYMEYASQIHSYIRGDTITKIGYSLLPGNTPANIGWNLGACRTSSKTKLIGNYFNWICEKSTSYYMTILDGQSTVAYPYQNHEILQLYPWLELCEDGLANTRSRIYPYKGKNRVIPPYETEEILCHIFHEILVNHVPVPKALQEGQLALVKLFSQD